MRDEMIDKLENILKTVGADLLRWRGNAGMRIWVMMRAWMPQG
jgi:hypothetical protein